MKLTPFISQIWVELSVLVILEVGLLGGIVPICINSRDNSLFIVAICCWIAAPIIALIIARQILRQWLIYYEQNKEQIKKVMQ